MSENHIERGEITPQIAVEQYLSAHPSIEFIDFSVLQGWCEAMKKARTAEEYYHAAWMHFELSTTPAAGDNEAISNERFRDGFLAADRYFSEALASPTATRQLKARATVGKASLPLQAQSAIGEKDSQLSQKIDHFEGYLLKVAKSEVSSRRERTVSEIAFAHALTAMLIINSQTNYSLLLSKFYGEIKVNDGRQFIALPAPSRLAEPLVPTDAAWNVRVWDFREDNDTIFRMRVGSQQAEHYMSLPLHLLDQQGYTRTHDFGTLQALVDRPRPRAVEHITNVRKNVLDYMHLDNERSNQVRDLPTNILPWYMDQPADVNPYSSHPGYVQDAIQKAEVHFMASGLRPSEVMTYGWLQNEIALGKEHINPAEAAHHFDQAITAFDRVVNGRWNVDTQKPNGLMRYQALIAKEAAIVQRALALNDPALPEKIAAYTHSINNITNNLEKTYGGLRQQLIQEMSEEDADTELYRLSYQLTLCLAAAGDPFSQPSRYIAFPAAPRQRRNNHQPGWDVTVLRREHDGDFVFGRQGRICIVSPEEIETMDACALLENRNIYILSKDELGVERLMLTKKQLHSPETIATEERLAFGAFFKHLAKATQNAGLL